jgi:hypothetical protein
MEAVAYGNFYRAREAGRRSNKEREAAGGGGK